MFAHVQPDGEGSQHILKNDDFHKQPSSDKSSAHTTQHLSSVIQHPHPARILQGQRSIADYQRFLNRKTVLTDAYRFEATPGCETPLSGTGTSFNSPTSPNGNEAQLIEPRRSLLQPSSPTRLLSKLSGLTLNSQKTMVQDGASDFGEYFRSPLSEKKTDVLFLTHRDQFSHLIAKYPLPPVSNNYAKYLAFTTYYHLMSLVLAANIAILFFLVCKSRDKSFSFTYSQASTATAINIAMGVIVRNGLYINGLFHSVNLLFKFSSLQTRRHISKFVYHQGGIHAGCGLSAFIWYIAYLVLLVRQFPYDTAIGRTIMILSSFIAVLLSIICGLSHPHMRAKYHDLWEYTHRWGGYFTFILIWSQKICIVVSMADKTNSIGGILISSPTFWAVIVVTMSLIHPWIHLRRHKITAVSYSKTSIQVSFPTKRPIESVVGIRLSRTPLGSAHGFATIPKAYRATGFDVLMTRAGDWTGNFMDNPPSYIWSRGHPTHGVLRMALLFKPIVLVATGSGIGPVLSFLNVHAPGHSVRVVWVTPNVHSDYSSEILSDIYRADPYATIVDTKIDGRPDIISLAWAVREARGGEAFGFIGRQQNTNEFVEAMESRGLPALGAIFDS